MADYSFLNSYLANIMENGNKVDPNVNTDDNNFYDIPSDDNQDDNFSPYGYTHDTPVEEQQSDDDYDQADQEDNDSFDQENSFIGGLLADDDDMYSDDSEDSSDDDSSGGGDESYYYTGSNRTMTPNGSDVSKKIAAQESEGMGGYNAMNTKGGGAGAVGKYQFRWNQWKDSIMKVTGVKSEEAFRKSPQAQEQYFDWYQRHYLAPEAAKLQKYNKKGVSEQQLEQLVHFRGAGGAKKWLLGQQSDKPEKYNVATSKYIGMKRLGGGVGVAGSAGAQYHGLNNPSYDHMFFPMSGINTFRGLDDGTPVYLEDEEGKKKVLKGKKHKAKMTGNVFESRLNK